MNDKKVVEISNNTELAQSDKILEVFACSSAKKSGILPTASVKKIDSVKKDKNIESSLLRKDNIGA